jgi:drug/metabolite transporter (DMT)-like permease
MPWSVLFSLILCNAIWATNPVMGKVLLSTHSPLEVSWLRYSSALFTALLLVLFLRWRQPRHLSPWRDCLSARRLPWLAILGLITFFGSGVVQYLGLSRSTSTANALIVAMEPLFAVLLARLFLGESLRPQQIAGFGISLAGFILLSNVKPGNIAQSFSLFNVGNLFLLATMPMEATYSIVSRRLAGKIEPVSVFAWALPIGFAALTAYLAWNNIAWPHPMELSGKQLLALLWLGPLGTTITYIYWTIALIEVPVAAVSLTLFAQPILGALAGTIFLGDRLAPWQLVGSGLIFGALCLQTQVELKREQDEQIV